MGDTIPILTNLATLSPPSTSRAWQSAPHPTLPIVATATSDKSVNIYSLTSFRLLNRVSGGHKRSVRSVGWRRPLTGSRRGAAVLATGSFDSTVGIWRGEGAGDDETKQTSGGMNDDVMLDSEPETEINDRRPLKTHDIDDEEAWQFAVLLTGHDSEVKSVAFSPSNPSLLATCSRDKSVWVWEEVSGGGGFEEDDDEYETIAVLSEHSGDVKCVSWNWESDIIASGSYDDTIRLWREVEEEGDWMCVACIDGHDGTVWCVQWEKPPTGENGKWRLPKNLPSSQSEAWDQWSSLRGSRIVSSSDDLTIRIWRRDRRSGDTPSDDFPPELKKNKIPSIIKPASTTEEWIQDAILPQMHERSIYSVAWSERTGRIASCGGDGSIYVYEEVYEAAPADFTPPADSEADSPDAMAPDSPQQTPAMSSSSPSSPPANLHTTWKPIYSISAAHGDFEINHICWAARRDRDRKKKKRGNNKDVDEDEDEEEEEILITTGDDGEVKVLTLD